jgi:hypothetical protein
MDTRVSSRHVCRALTTLNVDDGCNAASCGDDVGEKSLRNSDGRDGVVCSVVAGCGGPPAV